MAVKHARPRHKHTTAILRKRVRDLRAELSQVRADDALERRVHQSRERELDEYIIRCQNAFTQIATWMTISVTLDPPVMAQRIRESISARLEQADRDYAAVRDRLDREVADSNGLSRELSDLRHAILEMTGTPIMATGGTVHAPGGVVPGDTVLIARLRQMCYRVQLLQAWLRSEVSRPRYAHIMQMVREASPYESFESHRPRENTTASVPEEPSR